MKTQGRGFRLASVREEGSSGTAAACASCPHGHGRAAIPGQQHGALKCPCGQPRGHVQKLGISVRAVAGAVATLSNHNFIEVVKVGNMNVYRINSRVAWQGKARGKVRRLQCRNPSFRERAAGRLRHSPAAEVRSPTPERERLLVGNEELPPPDQQEMDLP